MKNKRILIVMMFGAVVLVAALLPAAISQSQKYVDIGDKDNMPIYEYEEEIPDTTLDSEINVEMPDTDNSKDESGRMEGIVSSEDESGRDMVNDDIKRLEINVLGMEEEARNKIKDYDRFVYAIKEYFYITGVMESNVRYLGISEDKEEAGLLFISMKVESANMQKFDVVFEEKADTYYVRLN